MADVVKLLPPAEDVIIRLGHDLYNLQNSSLHDLLGVKLESIATGKPICPYSQLKHIAVVIDSIAEAILDYAKAKDEQTAVS